MYSLLQYTTLSMIREINKSCQKMHFCGRWHEWFTCWRYLYVLRHFFNQSRGKKLEFKPMTRVCYSRDSATEPEEACGSLNNLLNQPQFFIVQWEKKTPPISVTWKWQASPCARIHCWFCRERSSVSLYFAQDCRVRPQTTIALLLGLEIKGIWHSRTLLHRVC